MRPDPPNAPALPPSRGDRCAIRQAAGRSILRRRGRQALVETLLIFCLFFAYAAWPAPDVNEAHYLCKVKQAWDPDWLPGDFFLNTPDAHPVFTWTCGWPTLFLSLPTFAWAGRLVTWLALAWAWRRLSHALVSRRWYAVLSAALFVAFSEIASPAGEWVVGGFEAKGPAFVLVLVAIERVVRNHWKWAFWLLGAASAFHVLVGGWATVAVGMAWLLEGRRRVPLKQIWTSIGGGLALALTAFIPALLLSWGASDAARQEANWTYVFWRLRHHLDPAAFAVIPLVMQVVFAAVCLGVLFVLRRSPWQRRWGNIVLGAMAIALIGYVARFALTWRPDIMAAVLRLYWFRLADALVPAGAALASAAAFSSGRPGRRRQVWTAVAVLCPALVLGDTIYHRWGAPPRADGADAVAYREWLGVCGVVRRDTPRDARFLTPLDARTFHWYAQRGEVVNWKDIPQDAASMVAWSRRIRDIYYPDEGGAAPLSDQDSDEVRQLAEDYRADYILTFADPPLDLPRVYGNDTYALYRVPPAPPDQGPTADGSPAQDEEPTGEEK